MINYMNIWKELLIATKSNWLQFQQIVSVQYTLMCENERLYSAQHT